MAAGTEDNDLLYAMRCLTVAQNDEQTTRKSPASRKPAKDDVEKKLESLFLTPNQRFSEDWLNKLQE